MSKVTIESKGTLGTTQVTLDDRKIDPSNLMKVQLHLDPQVPQPGCEITFVNEDGRIERWSGVNVDDEFSYLLDAVQDDTRYRVVADEEGVKILVSLPEYPDAPGLPVFVGAAMVVDVVADGFGVQLNKYHQIVVNPHLRSVEHA